MGNIFNISYSKKFPYIKISDKDLFSIFMIALIFGVFSFVLESLLDIINTNTLYDRGFLIGPFLPIYFFVTFFGLLFIKTPVFSLKNVFLSILVIGSGISVVEFFVGNIFELLFNIKLWNYDGFMPFSSQYVSLIVAITWGLLGSVIVFFVIPYLKKIVDRIPKKLYYPIFIPFCIIFLIDIVTSVLLILVNNGYRKLYEFEFNTLTTLFIVLAFLLIILILLIITKPKQKYYVEDTSLYQSKYPILLVHGMMLKDFKLYRAFRNIKDVLKDNDINVFVSDIDGIGTIKNNAMQLKEEILKILEEQKVDKINIIAHSKGGLDSRYMISMLDMDDKVASLTTLSTPHHGSKVSRKLLSMPKLIRNIIASFINLFYKFFKDKNPDIIAVGNELTDENMKLFNENVINSPKVYYQSYSSTLSSKKIFIMKIPYILSSHIESDETDGLVSVNSSIWGNYKGSIPSNYDHAEMVGAYGTYNSLLEVSKFYLHIIATLKENGF